MCRTRLIEPIIDLRHYLSQLARRACEMRGSIGMPPLGCRGWSTRRSTQPCAWIGDQLTHLVKAFHGFPEQIFSLCTQRLCYLLSVPDPTDQVHPRLQMKITQRQLIFHCFQVRCDGLGDGKPGRLNRYFILRHPPRRPLPCLSASSHHPQEMERCRSALIGRAPKPKGNSIPGYITSIKRLDGLFHARLEEFTKRRRLVIGRPRNRASVFRISPSRSFCTNTTFRRHARTNARASPIVL